MFDPLESIWHFWQSRRDGHALSEIHRPQNILLCIYLGASSVGHNPLPSEQNLKRSTILRGTSSSCLKQAVISKPIFPISPNLSTFESALRLFLVDLESPRIVACHRHYRYRLDVADQDNAGYE
jgi:hypothetical protein